MAHSAYERAIDLVLITTKNLAAAINVVNEDGAHVLASADDAAKYARAAWREAIENEAQVYDQMQKPPEPEVDPNQTTLLDENGNPIVQPAPAAGDTDLEPAEPGDEAGGETSDRAADESGDGMPLEPAEPGVEA